MQHAGDARSSVVSVRAEHERTLYTADAHDERTTNTAVGVDRPIG